MISIVSFSVGAPVRCKKEYRDKGQNYEVICPEILDPDDIINDMKFVTARLQPGPDWSPKWKDMEPILKSLIFMAETLKNQTETLNSLISPPPPPPSPSPPPPSPPPPSRCYYWSMVLGEGKTQKLMCKLGF
jgi:hypothetical protein